MIPFTRILNYGNVAVKSFKGIMAQITAGSGYTPVGRNNTCSCSVNTATYPRVYFYGGLNAAGTYLTDVFYYDMVLNRYVSTSLSGLGAYRGATMAYNDDGYIYVFGGANTSNVGQTQFFRISVSGNNTALITNDTNRPGGNFSQTSLSLGNDIFFFGGSSTDSRQTVYRYNVSTRLWTTVRTGVTTPDLFGGQVSIVYNNKMYIGCSDGIYEFNTTTFALTKLPNQPSGYSTGSYSVIVEGKWYFIKNITTGASSNNTVSRYNDDDGTWTIINTTALEYEIAGGWKGYNSTLDSAYILFGGTLNERSARIRKFT